MIRLVSGGVEPYVLHNTLATQQMMDEPGKGDGQHRKRHNDGTNYNATPPQRQKPSFGVWRAWETPTEDTPQSTVEHVAQDSLYPREHPSTLLDEHQPAVPQSTYLAVIRDALMANPGGMTTPQIMVWLEDNRPEVFKPKGKERFKASMQATLSTQSKKKKKPIVCKYEGHGGGSGSRCIWRLQQCVEVDEAMNPSRGSIPANGPATSVDGHDEQSLLVSHREASHDLQEYAPIHSGSSGGPAVKETSVSRVTPTRNRQEDQELLTLAEVQHEKAVAGPPNPQAVDVDSPERDVSAGGEGESEQPLRLGRLVLQLRSLKRTNSLLVTELNSSLEVLPDIDALERQADEKSHLAQQLADQAAEARTQAEAYLRDLEQAQNMVNKVSDTKAEIQRIEKELRETRASLEID